MVHAKHGRLPWARLFEPALRLADDGFEVSPRLHYLLRWHGPSSFVPAARSYFFTETGNAWPIGYQLKNPAFAATLRRIAAEGARGFYEGPVAEAIVAAVAAAPVAPGGMTLADLAGYTAKERQPVCTDYRGDRICGMGPPSSGGYTVAQTMKLIERFDLGGKSGAPLQPRALHLIAEAEKLAFADRNRYLADPDFVTIPDGLLDPGYLDKRRALIDPLRAMDKARAGRAARPRPAVVRARRNDRARRHEPHLDHRRRRQRARHDHDHRRRVRLAQLGGGLPAEQRADRFLLPPRRRRGTRHRQRRRPGQAAAQLHGADDRVRRRAARSSPCSARPAAARSSSMW